METIILTSLEKLRQVSKTVTGIKLQITQLEMLLSEARKEILKLKSEKLTKEEI
jgi:hypothetical protein